MNLKSIGILLPHKIANGQRQQRRMTSAVTIDNFGYIFSIHSASTIRNIEDKIKLSALLHQHVYAK